MNDVERNHPHDDDHPGVKDIHNMFSSETTPVNLPSPVSKAGVEASGDHREYLEAKTELAGTSAVSSGELEIPSNNMTIKTVSTEEVPSNHSIFGDLKRTISDVLLDLKREATNDPHKGIYDTNVVNITEILEEKEQAKKAA